VPLGTKLLTITPKAEDMMLVQLGGAHSRELTRRTAIAPGASFRMPDAAI
jgi:hypothetical protein